MRREREAGPVAIWEWGGEHVKWKEQQVSKPVGLKGAWCVHGTVKGLCVGGLTAQEKGRNQIVQDLVILSVMKSHCRVWSRDIMGVMLHTTVLGDLEVR